MKIMIKKSEFKNLVRNWYKRFVQNAKKKKKKDFKITTKFSDLKKKDFTITTKLSDV